MTEADWKQQLAAVHPDRGGDVAAFQALSAAREAWRVTHRICRWCRHPFIRSLTNNRRGYVQRYCSQNCANKAIAAGRRKRVGAASS